MTDDPPPFRLELAIDGRSARLHLSGDADLVCRERLRSALDRAIEAGPTCWVDLDGLTFADLAVVEELLRGQHAARRRGECLLVVPPADPTVLGPFAALGVLAHLPFVSGGAATC